MLRLETEAGVLLVAATAFAGAVTVEEITGVEHNPGLGGMNFQSTSRLRVENARGQFRGFSIAVQRVAVVVTDGFTLHLINSPADGGGRGEIHRRVPDGKDFACGKQFIRSG